MTEPVNLHVQPLLSRTFPSATYAPREVVVFKGGKRATATVEAPTHWDDNAVATVVEKYLRRAGVPDKTTPAPDRLGDPRDLPDALRPRVPAPDATFGAETSVKQALHRLAGAWAYHALRAGYFDAEGALVFYREVLTSLEQQMASPNSPQWFNTGLHWAYGITGGRGGGLFTASELGVQGCHDTYTSPQASACFIQGVEDTLVGEGGIMGLWSREAAIFKGGSGSGVNVSAIRAEGEALSNGGVSSGVMGFLEIGDKAAGAIKSAGTTRRAAKMLCMDDDHPEVLDFVRWKLKEERKVAALVVGSALLKGQADHLAAAIRDHGADSPQAQRALTAARIHGLPNGLLSQIIAAAKAGHALDFDVMDTDWQGEAYRTVSGQNSNNTVRLSGDFLRAVEQDGPWTLKGRVDARVNRTIRARDLWDQIVTAAWASADPGLHFKDTINDWHTCPEDGLIEASNPCSEYLFLNNTACNLASLNLCRFFDGQHFDDDMLAHASRLWTVVLEVSVGMAGYPTPELAHNSWRYRTLGLGVANLGALLMRMGLPYDSDKGRFWARGVMALINAVAYDTSAHMAQVVGPYEAWERNKVHALRVLANHAASVENDLGEPTPYQGLRVEPMPIPLEPSASSLHQHALAVYDKAVSMARQHGLRNAQLTVCAPTGTISFQMGCDTTGCEPDFALVKHKSYAGGGSRTLLNASIRPALASLSWRVEDIEAACAAIEARGYFFHQDPFLPGHPRPDCLSERDYELAGEVLACAAANVPGVKTISPMAHIKMLGALQPHISGALSKTVNLPHEATLEDIAQVYREAYALGVKAIAVYRDGSKLSQPLNLPDLAPQVQPAPQDHPQHQPAPEPAPEPEPQAQGFVGVAVFAPSVSPIQASRVGLPALAEGLRLKVTLAGHTLYLHTGQYADGRLGEVFVTMGGQGGDLGAWIGAWAQSVSVALQHGTPFAALARSFLGHVANPSGFVQGLRDVEALAHIRTASSPMDLIFQVLAAFYDDDGIRRGFVAQPDAQPAHVIMAEGTVLTLQGEVKIHGDGQVTMANGKHAGGLCPSCGCFGLRRSGSCYVCDVCHTTTGCS